MKIRWKQFGSRGIGLSYLPGTPNSAYDKLLYTIFQRPRQDRDRGLVIALTSVASGEGVTYVTRAIVNELAKSELNAVAQINARFLRRLYEPTAEHLHDSLSRSPANGLDLSGPDHDPVLPARTRAGRWESSWEYRRDCIDLLRREFDYTLIDCPSLRESGDVLSMSPFLDGVILVVEANRTRAGQIRQAEVSIEAAQGKLLGHILNKRTYDVPAWIYDRL